MSINVQQGFCLALASGSTPAEPPPALPNTHHSMRRHPNSDATTTINTLTTLHRAALSVLCCGVGVALQPDFYSSQPVQIQGSFNDWSAPFSLNHDPETGKVGGVVQLEAHHGVSGGHWAGGRGTGWGGVGLGGGSLE